MENDRGGRLFREQLIGAGELHPELGFNSREQGENFGMVCELRDRRVAPRITLALIFADAQLAPYMLVNIVGRRFGGLNGEAMREIGLGIIPRLLQGGDLV